MFIHIRRHICQSEKIRLLSKYLLQQPLHFAFDIIKYRWTVLSRKERDVPVLFRLIEDTSL